MKPASGVPSAAGVRSIKCGLCRPSNGSFRSTRVDAAFEPGGNITPQASTSSVAAGTRSCRFVLVAALGDISL